MTQDQPTHRDTATETHHEPHGSASPHGPADDVPGHEPADGGHAAVDDGHGAHDVHGEALGPVDVRAWAAGAVGILLGLVVVACMVVATRGLVAG